MYNQFSKKNVSIQNTMKNINDIWGFIEENYEGYYNSDAILEHDILTRFIENEAVDDDDIRWIKDNFKSADEIRDKLIVKTIGLISEALIVYYDKLFKQIGEKVNEKLKE